MSADLRRPLSLVHTLGSDISVHRADAPHPHGALMRYVYRPTDRQYESPRPYIHPVRTLSGRLVTVFRPWDHVWHKGFTLALPNVGDDNFWGGATYSRRHGGYRDLENNGSQDHDALIRADADEQGVHFAHHLTWHRQPRPGAEGDAVIAEDRIITARLALADDAWILGWRSVIGNISGRPIDIGSPTTEGRENAGYGGLFWRGPRSFTGGYMTGSGGAEGEELRGATGAWAGFSGRHDAEDAASTVVFLDDTLEQGLATKWFARSTPFACLNPAPFFDRVRRLEPGEELDLRYAVVIADGASDRDRMAALAALAGARAPHEAPPAASESDAPALAAEGVR